jgi:hypothetical protein
MNAIAQSLMRRESIADHSIVLNALKLKKRNLKRFPPKVLAAYL